MGLFVASGAGAAVQIEDPSNAGTWWLIPGLSEWREVAGDVESRTVRAFEGAAQIQGTAGIGTLEWTAAAYIPQQRAWKALRAAAVGNTKVRIRMTTPPESVIYDAPSGVTAKVAADGGVVFVGSDFDITRDEFAPGHVLRHGASGSTVDLVLEEMTSALVAESSGTAVLAAATFKIVAPQLRRGPFATAVGVVDVAELTAEGELTGSVTMTPTARLDAFTIVPKP